MPPGAPLRGLRVALGALFGAGQFATGMTAIGQLALGKYVLAQLGVGRFVWSSGHTDSTAVEHFQDLWNTVKSLFLGAPAMQVPRLATRTNRHRAAPSALGRAVPRLPRAHARGYPGGGASRLIHHHLKTPIPLPSSTSRISGTP